MPNHLHVLIDFGKSAKSINTIVSNGKRFMAYTIVERLKEHNRNDILKQLSGAVNPSGKDKGKIHQVFERSFDCKEITSQHFFMQKVSYIHNNPCSGVCKLVEIPSIIYIARQIITLQENRAVIFLTINCRTQTFLEAAGSCSALAWSRSGLEFSLLIL